MKKNIILFIIAILLFVGCPLLAKIVIPKEAGMMVMIFLLLVLYPVFFIANGIISIANIKKSWYTTLVFTGIFAVSYAVILGMKEPFYYVIYLALGYMIMLGGIAVKKLQKKRG